MGQSSLPRETIVTAASPCTLFPVRGQKYRKHFLLNHLVSPRLLSGLNRLSCRCSDSETPGNAAAEMELNHKNNKVSDRV
ncbi:hypothetical protein PBY51_003586 [Eleginops maclovinus]|uniref:Uncharacterized protein n=1 Tax=Eleginops maclovinus TaxID=56733 RepID=A0AAN8AVM9_ELEMC|nr:hypothetical protein PBY51_003586 [Eleginops maclovinus]